MHSLNTLYSLLLRLRGTIDAISELQCLLEFEQFMAAVKAKWK